MVKQAIWRGDMQKWLTSLVNTAIISTLSKVSNVMTLLPCITTISVLLSRPKLWWSPNIHLSQDHKKIKSPRYSLDMSATVQFQWCLLILKLFQLERVTFAHGVYSVVLELLWNGDHGPLKLSQYHQRFLKRKVARIYPTIIPSRLMCLGYSVLETVALWVVATCHSCSSTSAQPFITCPL